MIKHLSAKELLFQSIDELSKEKDMRKITVDEITSNCGYKRGIFYYYFDSKEDLIIRSFQEYVTSVHEECYGIMSWKQMMEQYLVYCREHDALMTALTKQSTTMDQDMNTFFQKYLFNVAMDYYKATNKIELSEELQMAIAFYSSGVTKLLGEWIVSQYQFSISTMANMIDEWVPKRLRVVLDYKKEC